MALIATHIPEQTNLFGDEALIITDGRNLGDELFKRMIRPNGYSWLGRHYHLRDGVHQPNVEGLYTIQVKPVTDFSHQKIYAG